MTRALADSYRAELVRAARRGAAFALETGEPESWAAAEPAADRMRQRAVTDRWRAFTSTSGTKGG